MSIRPKSIRASAPGRLCLFGEHQDYLGLPVVPLAISLRVEIAGSSRTDRLARIALPDASSSVELSIDGPLRYEGATDFFRAGLNVMRRAGHAFERGFDCEARGGIPIRAGASSSSALVVAWIAFLARMRGAALSAGEIARLAYEAEVIELGGAGGMMDQLAAAYGGASAVTFHPEPAVERLEPPRETFVLGDSGEPKDTQAVLSRVKGGVLEIVRRLAGSRPKFSLRDAPLEERARYAGDLSRAEIALLAATLANRDITRRGIDLLRSGRRDDRALGLMLDEQQILLREALGISTPKIDRMLDAALRAGALGGKINGSGGGGCMFVYAPDNAPAAAEAIERAGGTAFVVRADEGVRIEESAG